AGALQAVFAQLRQSHPRVGLLYAQHKLWEAMPAEQAAVRLVATMEQSMRHRNQALVERAGRSPLIFAPLRWLMTLGALLWFVLVQPVAELLFAAAEWPGPVQAIGMLIRVLSVQVLLESAIFILLWFVVLWVVLRWQTQR